MEKQDFQQLKNEFATIREFLLALGDEKRQIIIMALLEQETCEGLRVTDLTELTHLSRPAVSHHLNILKQANIVAIRSEGTKNYYYFSNMIDSVKDMKKLNDHLLTLLEEKDNDIK
ncbi:metalloregulator ArsR/SmtB family transcription factor [Tetragenococcus koreensis]|uniref:ArsR family transcriptional regulator n=1 Tax=Tetragenococcus koreensis TaxID=290335 RepID=A0AAN4RJS1_9ENTE|nr:metalloregulator ArsR/SmtB family transcription factor [Tetragenococcus koreensis]MCF1585561.1 metalloregulator ArsR/SmtB family transcription factor [Tetragenococcus koreensis]MCF1615107.1 metalloregulator ArsR/SmtB family transcription factor [Tetragenococcus koreensis]MCF1620697.1 metalloregulator ArsR/SmtB family transcription factor [Tetragenococcus koreensis]MCF1624935.1 metalloregulator ArsR/SmtB family transcription factor [Tetragenococcus koreensis]MCF1626317.1 metalloregulator Ars